MAPLWNVETTNSVINQQVNLFQPMFRKEHKLLSFRVLLQACARVNRGQTRIKQEGKGMEGLNINHLFFFRSMIVRASFVHA